jgi:DNA-binding GntR family transcriptional regulator
MERLMQTTIKVERNIPTLRELTLEKMRGAILDLVFQPGDRLIERELCDRLGVSRTIVREVLRHLEAEGLVQNLPHRGPMVAKPTVEETRQIYELRGMLEGMAAKACAELKTPAVAASLNAALRDIRKAYQNSGTNTTILQATMAFYHEMFRAAGKTVAWGIESSLNARINHLRAITTRTPGRDKTGPKALQAVVDAIRDGEPEKAYKACIAHVTEASSLAQQYLMSTAATDGTPATRPARRQARASG